MKLRVNVVMGGPSAEYEVSIRSGREVCANLDRDRYQIRAVVISKDREFFTLDITGAPPSIEQLSSPADSGLFAGPYPAAQSHQVWETCDVAFLALHGTFGEDGIIQGFFETINMPYTGSGVFASALAMNKIVSKFAYIQHGLDVPQWSIFGPAYPHLTIDSIAARHGFPCFVKCPQSGSSRLLGRANDKESLRALISELLPYSAELLVESAVKGTEFSCGVLDLPDGTTSVLPPVEIRPFSAAFFDYEAKYTDGGSEEIVPAPHEEPLLERVRQIALAAHRILGCRGVSRTDMILCDDKLYVLETNTLPGLTPNSLLPKAFKAAGGTYSGLLDTLIGSALSTRK